MHKKLYTPRDEELGGNAVLKKGNTPLRQMAWETLH